MVRRSVQHRNPTERRVVDTSRPKFPGFKSRLGDRLNDRFLAFPHPSRKMLIFTKNRPRLLLQLPIYHSPITPSFDAVQSKSLKETTIKSSLRFELFYLHQAVMSRRLFKGVLTTRQKYNDQSNAFNVS
jgi:hypothetical protein